MGSTVLGPAYSRIHLCAPGHLRSGEVLFHRKQPSRPPPVARTEAQVTEDSYDDGNIRITIETERDYGSTVYIADIQVSDPAYLKTAFADSTYGRNIKQTTSDIAEANDAIFAVNGDYYGFRNSGYVLRNGVAYRSAAGSGDALVIDEDGDIEIISESETSLASTGQRLAGALLRACAHRGRGDSRRQLKRGLGVHAQQPQDGHRPGLRAALYNRGVRRAHQRKRRAVTPGAGAGV